MNIEQIKSLLESYSAAWAANDAEKIAAHWDAEEQEPFYKAEEILNYYHSLDEIKEYWAHNERFHEKICLKFSNISLKPLPGNYAVVFIRMRWDIRFAKNVTNKEGAAFSHAGKAMGGENHVLALVRESGSSVKLVGWNETPDAPITYMGQLYQWIADPEIHN